MNTFKKTLIATALLATGAAAQAEVSGSAGIASQYIWRGASLSNGSAVVSGSLDYADESGIYAGVWASSGDDTYGSEYDIYAGWGGDITDSVSLDIGLVSYNYPNSDGEFEEAILGLGFGSFGLTYVSGLSDAEDYYAASYEVGDFSAVLGTWDEQDLTHLDLTYSLGDLAFTLMFNDGDDADADDQPDFVVSYSIPLGE